MATTYAYPSDVSDEEWTFVLPYLLLSKEDSGSRRHGRRAVFDAYRYLPRSGCGWRLLPGDLPPWKAVYDQPARWHAAGVSEALIADLRGMIRLGEGRAWAPPAAVLDSRTVKSTTSSTEAAYDGAKRVKGRKLHLAVDTLGHLLAAVVSPADVQDRAVVAQLCAEMQAEVEGTVTAAFVDQGYTGAVPSADAAKPELELPLGSGHPISPAMVRGGGVRWRRRRGSGGCSPPSSRSRPCGAWPSAGRPACR